MTILWEACSKCKVPYKVKKLKNQGSYQRFSTRGCAKCGFERTCEMYRNHFLIDIKNLINVRIKDERQWIEDDEDDVEARLERTMRFAIEELGVLEAEAALVWAMKEYWHEIRTTWVRSSLSRGSSQ